MLTRIPRHIATHNPIYVRTKLARLRASAAFTMSEEAMLEAASLRIAVRDTAFTASLAHYYRVGIEAVRRIEESLGDSRPSPSAILDMGCGYGRVMRFLSARFPQATVTACDVDRSAVDFCAKQFNAHKLYSSATWPSLARTAMFDVIWSGSLVTHLRPSDIEALLTFFREHLSPSGVLVFTTHGETVLRRLVDSPARYGVALDPTEVSSRFRDGRAFYCNYPGKTEQYGFSMTPRSWVMEALKRVGGLDCIEFSEAGWDNHQDVVAAAKTR